MTGQIENDDIDAAPLHGGEPVQTVDRFDYLEPLALQDARDQPRIRGSSSATRILVAPETVQPLR